MSTPKRIHQLGYGPPVAINDHWMIVLDVEGWDEAAQRSIQSLRQYMQNNLTLPNSPNDVGITYFTKGDDEYRFYASVIDFGGGIRMINAQCHVKGNVLIKYKGDVIPAGNEPQFTVAGTSGTNSILAILTNGNIQIWNESGNNVILGASWSTYTAGIAPA